MGFFTAPIRLSALTLFLILLGVILIGFLMHHTWETFQSMKVEGFTNDFTYSSLVSTELNGKYSTNNVKTAKLTENLFFDPVEKVIIDMSGDAIYMKRKDGTDLSYNTNTATATLVTYVSDGSVDFVDSSFIIVPLGSLSKATVWGAKNYFRNIDDNNKIIYMDISGVGLTKDSDTLSSGNVVRVYFSQNASPPLVAMAANNYPKLIVNTLPYRSYKRTYAQNGGMDVASATTQAAPVVFGWYAPNGLGIVSIPLYANGLQTNTTFIHVMDIDNNKHICSAYFQGNEVEIHNFSNKAIVGSGKIIGSADTTGTDVVFAKDISGLTLPFHETGSNIYVDAYYDTAKKLIYIACNVGNNMHQSYIKIPANKIPQVVSSQTGNGTGTSASISSSSSTIYNGSSSSSSSSSSGSDSLDELTKAMELVKKMQFLFGSQDSNYLLKTEVVPPVCPTCPSCSSANGVCTNCGGHGGGGTTGDGVTSLIRDGAGGAAHLGRDVVGGTVGLGKEAVKGTVELGKDAIVGGLGLGLVGASAVTSVASGAGNFVKDSASGAGNFVKDSASGAGNFVKDSASGVYGATKEVVGGTVGLGREAVGGLVGLGGQGGGGGGGYQNNNGGGGYQNSYGGPQFQGGGGGGGNQGGYLQPQRANSQGQDPYSYYGALPPRAGGKNFVPMTADFSSFGR